MIGRIGIGTRVVSLILAAAALAACGSSADRQITRREQAEIQRSVPLSGGGVAVGR